MRGKAQGLTVMSVVWSVGSGTRRRWQIDGGDPRWPRRGTAELAASRASGAFLLGEGGRGERGGASWRFSEARGARWSWLRRAALSGAFGDERKGEQRRRRGPERVRGSGCAWRRGRRPGQRGGSQAEWRWRARAASTRPPAYWQEAEDGAAAGLGQLQCWARWAVKEVSPGGVSLSLLF